jgi:ribosomal protein S18 acetylase RimI-like enzyme
MLNMTDAQSDVALIEAQPSDYLRIAHLHALSWRSAYRGIVSEEYLENHVFEERLAVWKARIGDGIAPGQSGILACAGTELLGFAWVRLDAHPKWGSAIDNLHVNPSAKGRKIGRRLMARAAGVVIRQRPGSALHLWVLEANHPARGFYERLGGVYHERGTRPTGDGKRAPGILYLWNDPAILMAKTDEHFLLK